MTPAALKSAREKLGLSHDRLGKIIGLSRSTLIRYEKPTAKVPKVVALAIRYLLSRA